MNGKIPHIVQYQGSKRKLAPQILQYMPSQFKRLVEPFSGMAAISIATAFEKRAEEFYINDLNTPLVQLLQDVVENPDYLLSEYNKIWKIQFEYGENHVQHFYDIREQFNNGEQTSANMLYLLARCVKGAVRYGKNGKFNQSPDKRRHGTKPQNLAPNVYAISRLLKGKTIFSSIDYREVLDTVRPGDLVYMDPPYQGVTNMRDNRYYAGVPFDEFSEALQTLQCRGIDYLVSYDGICGEKTYGKELPSSLQCHKVLLNAGVSSQATLLGRKSETLEALYISETLMSSFQSMPEQLVFMEGIS